MSNEIQVNKQMLIGIAVVVIFIGILGVYTLTKDTTANVPSSSSIQPNTYQNSQQTAGTDNSTAQLVNDTASVQDIYIHANADGSYNTNEITVMHGIPVRVHFTADSNAGCGSSFQIRGLNVFTQSRGGQESIVEFTPNTQGTYQYTCGMSMWGPGKLIVQ